MVIRTLSGVKTPALLVFRALPTAHYLDQVCSVRGQLLIDWAHLIQVIHSGQNRDRQTGPGLGTAGLRVFDEEYIIAADTKKKEVIEAV